MEYEQLSQPTGKPLSLAELVAAVDSALFRDENYDSDFLPAPDAPEATSLPSRKAYDLEDMMSLVQSSITQSSHHHQELLDRFSALEQNLSASLGEWRFAPSARVSGIVPSLSELIARKRQTLARRPTSFPLAEETFYLVESPEMCASSSSICDLFSAVAESSSPTHSDARPRSSPLGELTAWDEEVVLPAVYSDAPSLCIGGRFARYSNGTSAPSESALLESIAPPQLMVPPTPSTSNQSSLSSTAVRMSKSSGASSIAAFDREQGCWNIMLPSASPPSTSIVDISTFPEQPHDQPFGFSTSPSFWLAPNDLQAQVDVELKHPSPTKVASSLYITVLEARLKEKERELDAREAELRSRERQREMEESLRQRQSKGVKSQEKRQLSQEARERFKRARQISVEQSEIVARQWG